MGDVMKRTREQFREALQGKNIPVLTLDNKWHQLFTQAETTEEIEALSRRLNQLLMRQGKLNTETKEIRRIRKRLMDEVMENAEELQQEPDKKLAKKQEDNRRLLEECKQRLEANQEELKFLPDQIDQTNQELMLASMEACYDFLKENSREIEELDAKMKELRIELKKKTVRKQEKEKKNQELYTYMREFFGPEVVELFDRTKA